MQIHHSFPEIGYIYMLLFILGNSIQGMSYRNMMKPKNEQNYLSNFENKSEERFWTALPDYLRAKSPKL